MLHFKGIPNFAPEILKRVRVRDPLKQKHLRKALESLGRRGRHPSVQADHRFVIWSSALLAQLQFEVLDERMKAEYGLEVLFETSPYQAARWISAETPRRSRGVYRAQSKMQMAEDVDGSPVFLGKSDWEIGYVQR